MKCSISTTTTTTTTTTTNAGTEIRRASVALVLRQRGGAVEILLIKRATNPQDPWSGDVAFPGGRQEPGETDLETCLRECKEEVGLDLTAGGVTFGGQLGNITISGRGGRADMVLSSFVFCQGVREEEEEEEEEDGEGTGLRAPLRLQASEVACAWWARVDDLYGAAGAECNFPSSRMIPALRRSPLLRRVASLLRCDTVAFRGVFVEPPTSQAAAQSQSDSPFFCWGITYDLLLHLRKRQPRQRWLMMQGTYCRRCPHSAFASDAVEPFLWDLALRSIYTSSLRLSAFLPSFPRCCLCHPAAFPVRCCSAAAVAPRVLRMNFELELNFYLTENFRKHGARGATRAISALSPNPSVSSNSKFQSPMSQTQPEPVPRASASARNQNKTLPPTPPPERCRHAPTRVPTPTGYGGATAGNPRCRCALHPPRLGLELEPSILG